MHTPNGVYCQESQPRSLDNQVFKYVGITRIDQPGVIQVGFKMDSLLKNEVRIEGFAVVAEEVYKLAEQSHAATREIRRLITGIQAAIGEANQAMQISRDGVKTSKQQADQAGQVLEIILSSVKDVYGQAQSAFNSTRRIQELATTLNTTVATVSRVVNQNASAAQEMDGSYSRVASAMQGIAELSKQNGASAREVSDSTGEMRKQADQVNAAAEALNDLASSLQETIQQFNLN
jgi:methyl-accepting chemotaxis protein